MWDDLTDQEKVEEGVGWSAPLSAAVRELRCRWRGLRHGLEATRAAFVLPPICARVSAGQRSCREWERPRLML